MKFVSLNVEMKSMVTGTFIWQWPEVWTLDSHHKFDDLRHNNIITDVQFSLDFN